MKTADFEKMKERWLRDHFAQAVTTKPEQGGAIATVPLLFRAEPYMPRTRSELTSTGRDRFVLVPVEGHGFDPKDSIAALFDEIVMNPRTWFGTVNEYLPKPGQNPEEVIKVGEPMVVVRHDDPEHEHGSPRLVDLLCHRVMPFGGPEPLFEKGSLAGLHCHFLIG